ncbi:Major facilitator superfamily domain, general substrate transporter [Pleurostoma richardsiae]|uniref:Major facilitator superfamily domain, general substrate transporter n=1 Tax=Pleurostoma richardsiae TaxID=41990 RepID=A0AA38S0Q2_9PEZI|nr:Major facilitator superfamily domain, general substrate transporter [Pleurostoma richardsiae]
MYLAYKYIRRKYQEQREVKSQDRTVGTRTGADAEADYELVSSGRDGAQALTRPPGTPSPLVDGVEVMTKQTEASSRRPGIKKGKQNATPEEIADAKRRRNLRYKVMFGLALPFALQSLDTTIIASALPFIADDFHQVQQLNWIISVFNLTSAAFLPFWAQIADIFGRHVTIHTTILIMAVGSAVCTGAPTSQFGVLLFGRALQGVGAAGVNITGHTIMADRVSLEDYAWNWTLSALISAVSFGIGPVIGGYMTQASWRWCFAINLPVAAVGIALVILLLRKELVGPQPIPEVEGRDMSTRHARFWLRLSTTDYGGQLLFLCGLTLIILAFTWAGASYSWDSVHVLLPLVLGCVLTAAWIMYEYSMSPPHLMSRVFPTQRAMMLWELLSQRDIGLLFLINFAMGMAMFAVMYFVDLYFVLVLGYSASKAGRYLLYYLPGLGVGAYMAQTSSSTWPRQTLPPLLLGSITSAVGISILAWATDKGNTHVIFGMMALTGHGVGMRMNPGALHGLAYFPSMTAQITCLVTLAVPLGGIVALTLMSTVFNNKSGVERRDAKSGIMYAFVAIIPFMWLCVVFTTFLGNAWILEDGGHEIVHGPYLWSLLTGKQLKREKRNRSSTGMMAETQAETSVTAISDEDA